MFPAVAFSQEEETDEGAGETAEDSQEPAPEEPSGESGDVEAEPSEIPAEEPAGATGAEPEPEEGGGEVEAWLPPPQEPPEEYDSGATFDDNIGPVDTLPFAKGDMELGFGLGGWGGNGYFSLAVGASFAYYVVPRLAPGLSIEYQTIFGDLEYPQSLTTLPFLKFVLIRSRAFAPYLVAAAGRDFQWAGTDNPENGYAAVGSWIVGGGVGAHIGMGANFALNLEVLFLYYFFDETVIIAGDSKPVDGHLYIPISIGFSIFF